jgi:type VI secretion system protein ImpL
MKNYHFAAAGALITYMAMTFAMAKFMDLTGPNYYIFYSLLTIIGLIAVGIFVWWKSRNEKAEVPTSAEGAAGAAASMMGGNDEIEMCIKDAEAKLAASKLAGGSGLSNLPLVFLMGEQGSTKTSVLMNSAMEPELLAGHVFQENTIVPTRSTNLWFARGTVFTEVGSALLGNSDRWQKIIKRLRPGALKSALGSGTQAPRGVLLCFDAEIFTQPNAADRLAATARQFQARLGDISSTLGISLPVYVLFTRCDKLNFFQDYMRTLTNDEAAQVLGVTLPIRNQQGGVYAEEESSRLNGAFNSLVHSLADKRNIFLARESDPAKVPTAYEFPREFRKLRASLVQFLVDVCRPSQLSVSPFLRGFYFCGVRPIFVNETAPVQRQQQAKAYEASAGATGMFQLPQSSPAPMAEQVITGTKKVPQWMFLPHFFHYVLLQDKAAMGASGASVKTSATRRALLWGASALCMLLAIGWTISYFNNRGLVNTAVDAARGISSVEGGGTSVPSLDSLQKLDKLRESLVTLRKYEQEGAPLFYRFGLYTGSDLLPKVRQVYFAKFSQMMFAQTQGGLLEHLKNVKIPPAPTDDYGSTYRILRSYLITTSNHEYSDREFAGFMNARWATGREVPADRAELVQRQWEFYADELKIENPYSSNADKYGRDNAREHLDKFSGTERIYQFMLAEANKNNKLVNFNKQFPGSINAVVQTKDVPGAFTKPGWAWMDNAFKNINKYFGGEEWVLGKQKGTSVTREQLDELRARYRTDYIAAWRDYIKTARVVGYAGYKDAATKLNQQVSPQSPILSLFWLASQNTGVDNKDIQTAFQPVHATVPPTQTDRPSAPTNQNYLNGLISLQSAIDQVSNDTGPMDAAKAAPSVSAASQAKISVKQMASTFSIDQQAHIEGNVQKLLEDPITMAEGLFRNAGKGEGDGAAGGLCTQIRPILSKFPFNPKSQVDATMADVDALLKPGQGILWQVYEQKFKAFLMKSGSTYVGNPAAPFPINPAFVNFYNQAQKLSDLWYKGGAQVPAQNFTLTPTRSDEVTGAQIAINGTAVMLTPAGGPGKSFAWSGASASTAKIAAADFPAVNYSGNWAPFHLFAVADRFSGAGGIYNMEYDLIAGLRSGEKRQSTVRMTLDLQGAPPFFREGLNCVPKLYK